MRQFALTIAIAASLVGAAPVLATEAAPASPVVNGVATTAVAKTDKPTGDDPHRIVCKREHVVGTNRPQKVCMTVAERERLKDAVSERLRNGRGTDHNTDIGGPGR